MTVLQSISIGTNVSEPRPRKIDGARISLAKYYFQQIHTNMLNLVNVLIIFTRQFFMFTLLYPRDENI